MDSDTETESESNASVTGAEWDASDYGHFASTPAACTSQGESSVRVYLASEIKSAVEVLGSLNLEGVEHDDTLQEIIHQASSIILSFLSDVALDETTREESATAYSHLFDISFVSMLFRYRHIFHGIAAREAGVLAVVVCWVDVVLSRLGEAIVQIAGGDISIAGLKGPTSESLQKQRDDDALRAAVQLPQTWSAVAGLISSKHASPAAARLALRLVFAVYVMGPQLGCASPWGDVDLRPGDLLHVLQSYAQDSTPDRIDQDIPDIPWLHLQERIAYAMIVSLFACVDSAQHDITSSPFRPHTQAKLLRLIQYVMHPHEEIYSLTLVEPCISLDAAHVILLEWGRTVPWCWSVWNDPRIANSESVEYLTVTWLYHLEQIINGGKTIGNTDSWEAELLACLDLNIPAGANMMNRLLQIGICHLTMMPLTYLSAASIDFMHKCCWGSTQLLLLPKDHDPPVLGLVDPFCRLFVLYRETPEELQTKDLIIEGLSAADHDILLVSMNSVMADIKIDVRRRLEDSIIRIRRHIMDGDSRATFTKHNLHEIKQILQFASLMWFNGIRGCFHRPTISILLRTLVEWLGSQPSDTACSLILRDSLVTALAILEKLKDDPSFNEVNNMWENETIWQMSLDSEPTDLITAASFSAYLVSGIPNATCDPLYYAESWDYLRDALLLILTHHFIGPEEPIALLFGPGICESLLVLLQYADHNCLQFELSSPWTMTLCTELKKIIAFTGTDNYGSVLKQQLRSLAGNLISQINACLLSEEEDVQLVSRPAPQVLSALNARSRSSENQ